MIKVFQKLPFLSFTINSAYDFVAQASQNIDKIHIIDITRWTGSWEPLLRSFSEAPRSPIVRITTVEPPPGAPSWGMGPCIPGEALKAQVLAVASELKVQVEFNCVASKLEELDSKILGLREDESVIVFGLVCLRNVLDGSVLRSNPRDKFLKVISFLEIQFLLH